MVPILAVCYLNSKYCESLSYCCHQYLLLLLLLSHFSRVRLCVTPQTAAHQAPPSLGFSRQEHSSGLPFPSQCMKVKSESEVAQSCPTLSDPMDCSLPGSSVHGIFQARVLEWGAIAFSCHQHLVNGNCASNSSRKRMEKRRKSGKRKKKRRQREEGQMEK